jgi:hypothetical protein
MALLPVGPAIACLRRPAPCAADQANARSSGSASTYQQATGQRLPHPIWTGKYAASAGDSRQAARRDIETVTGHVGIKESDSERSVLAMSLQRRGVPPSRTRQVNGETIRSRLTTQRERVDARRSRLAV